MNRAKESEETEVKKDLDWLVQRIQSEREQLAQSFVKGKETDDESAFNDGKDKALSSVLRLIDQLDEPEVLSQEWIQEKSVPIVFWTKEQDVILAKELQNLLVPKQEKVKVPKFVGVVIELYKKYGNSLTTLLADLAYHGELQVDSIDFVTSDTMFDWADENSDTVEEIIARAWLNGFTVEKEPLYRARLKVITDEFIASYLCTQSSDAEERLKALEIGSKYIHEDYRHLSEFTEDELKRLDIWDSEQWEVEEVEE